MTEPEVAQAKAALAALPEAWISPEFSAAILDRASLQAIHRMVSSQVTAAQAASGAALAAVAQDPSAASLSTLVDAALAEHTLSDVQATLPPVTINLGACRQAVAVAGAALSQASPRDPLPLNYQDELVQWRNFSRSSGATVDAPVATDADRAAQASWTDADAQVKQWRDGVAVVRSLDVSRSDVLTALASAQSYCDQAVAITKVVEKADSATAKANAARAAAGLNWSAS